MMAASMRALAIVVLFVAACSNNERHCVHDSECVSAHGDFGLCLESHCAFKDDRCTGGYSFEDAAGDRANMCASAAEVGAYLDAGVAASRDAGAGAVDAR
jgi:hypothetical protein